MFIWPQDPFQSSHSSAPPTGSFPLYCLIQPFVILQHLLIQTLKGRNKILLRVGPLTHGRAGLMPAGPDWSNSNSNVHSGHVTETREQKESVIAVC